MDAISKHRIGKPIYLFIVMGFLFSACGTQSDTLKLFTPVSDYTPVAVTVEASSIDDQDAVGDGSIPTEIAGFLDVEVRTNTDDEISGAIPNPREYQWNAVAQGFNAPVQITHAGDGSGRLFVVEQAGLVWELDRNFERDEEPFLDIQDRVLLSYEQGLLGLAFSPDFIITGYVFVFYTNSDGDTTISRFTTDRFKTEVDESFEEVILMIEQPTAGHPGGQLAFGPNEFLYIGVGDGGRAGDPDGNAQSLDVLLGKILRINVDFGVDYVIPPDNPYFGLSSMQEIWASGLHHPYRFSFDRIEGDLYISDTGQSEWEEINFMPADSLGGTNFGWNYYEGSHIFGDVAPNIPFEDPISEYSHTEEGCSVIGGYVYRGIKLSEWDGVYLYGDRCTGTIWGTVRQADGNWITEEIFSLDIWIGAFGEDEFGEIYLVDFNNGDFYRLDKR